MDDETRSAYSNSSEALQSNASSLSGIYADEFVELQHLINPNKYPLIDHRSVTPKAQCENSQYEERIANLTNELQKALKQSEKYKNDLYNIEKNLELAYNEKIEKLIHSKNQLNQQLDSANCQINRLLKNYTTNTSKSNIFISDISESEKTNHLLLQENSVLKNKITQVKTQNDEYTSESKQLKCELNDLKLTLSAKNSCIVGLKDKVLQQHVQSQQHLQDIAKLTNSLALVNNELDHLKKSELWYKQQLSLCQDDKKKLSEDNLCCKTSLGTCNKKILGLTVEIDTWKSRCEELEEKLSKEKNVLCKLEQENTSRKFAETSVVNTSTEINYNLDNVAKYYEVTINDLTSEIARFKQNFNEQKIRLQEVTKENSDILSKYLTLQQVLQQSESEKEQCESLRKSLEMKLSFALDKEKVNYIELLSQRNLEKNLKVQLVAMRSEKDAVENSVILIREQFQKFKIVHENLKEDLHQSNKSILQLQKEKQELFMNNNWNLCELEKVKEKIFIINRLSKQLEHYEQQFLELNNNLKAMEIKHTSEINVLETKLTQKDELINNASRDIEKIEAQKSEEIKRYEQSLSLYKVTVDNLEDDKNKLENLLRDYQTKAIELQDSVSLLENEVKKCELKCAFMEKKYSQANKEYTKTLQDLDEEKNRLLLDQNKLVNYLAKFLANGFATDLNFNSIKLDNDSIINILNNFAKVTEVYHEEKNHIDKKSTTIHKLKHQTFSKLNKLEERIIVLQGKSDVCFQMLQAIPIAQIEEQNRVLIAKQVEEIKQLRATICVNDLERKERQKKYEANCRTLLRKVKEHMKGRNTAEKHNSYLQELYNNLSEEHNSIKLSFSSKEFEIENLQKLAEGYRSVYEKLKQTVFQMEDNVRKKENCQKCVDYLSISNNLIEMGSYVKDLETKNHTLSTDLSHKEEEIVSLEKQLQDLLLANACITNERNKIVQEIKELRNDKDQLCLKIKDLENDLERQESLSNEINMRFTEEREKYSNLICENNNITKILEETNEKNDFLSEEIKILKLSLVQKSEELKSLHENHHKFEAKWCAKHQEKEKIISLLKSHIHQVQNENNTIQNEKFFLQRLCNDLKIALRTHVGINQTLKEQILNLSKEKSGFNSLPNVLPDLPNLQSKYDEEYINQLLQQNRCPLQDKTFIDIQDSLNNLKKEVLSLQLHISEKNSVN